jgi:type IV secretory pathway component VirB8
MLRSSIHHFVEDTEEIQCEKNTWGYWTISLRYGSKHEMKFCKARNNNNQEARNQVSQKQRYVKFLSHTAFRLQNKRIKYSFFPLWVRGR